MHPFLWENDKDISLVFVKMYNITLWVILSYIVNIEDIYHISEVLTLYSLHLIILYLQLFT